MVNRLPRKNQYIFAKTRLGSLRNNLAKVRGRLADRLQNPRLARIGFHSIRHHVATRTYHRTKDLLFTQQALGHRSLKSTLRYTHLVNWENEDQFHSAVAKTVDEARKLVEGGWQYVTEMDNLKLFRKPM